jgi:G3E family GTPase
MSATGPARQSHSAASRRPLPVTILTGFLGAGKTTLLNDILTDPGMGDTAVIVNEFGSVGIDHDLVHAGREQYVVTSTGCLCCTSGSDIRASLYELANAADAGAVPRFSRVVVETTGLADPAPVVNSLIPSGVQASGLRDHVVARRFRLAGVVTAFDAVLGELALERHIACWKQLAFADHIVLTKKDLAQDPATRADVEATIGKLRALNPAARLWDRHDPQLGLPALFSGGSYDPAAKPEDVLAWLALERDRPRAHDHVHDPDRHGDRVRAYAFVEEAPTDPKLFDAFLSLLIGQPGALRVKGLIKLADTPDRPLLVHAVQHVLHEKRLLEAWPDADERSRLVIIGADLSPVIVDELFRAVRSRPPWWQRWKKAG